MRQFLAPIFISLVLSGCTISKSPAPIIYNHKNSNLSSSASDKQNEAPVINEDDIVAENKRDDKDYILPEQGPTTTERKTIYHEVKPGESIEDIALAYEQSVEEIARLNNLFPPYNVEPYQSLKINVDNDFTPRNNVADDKDEIPMNISDISFIKPVDGELIEPFGAKTVYGTNKGINIAAKAGTKVQASASGKVIYSDYDSTFGNLVIIQLEDQNLVTAYAHLEDLIVNKGAKISQGETIGYVSNTGKVRESQLHFAIRKGKKSINPLKYVQY